MPRPPMISASAPATIPARPGPRRVPTGCGIRDSSSRLLNRDDEFLGGGADSSRARGEYFFVAPSERLFVQGPHVPLDAGGDYDFHLARDVRCAREHARGFVELEPSRSLLQRECRFFDVKYATPPPTGSKFSGCCSTSHATRSRSPMGT